MSEKKTRAADKRKRQEDPEDSIKDEFKLKKTKATVESKTKAAVAKTGDKKLGKKTIDSLASMEYPCGKCYNMRCKNDLRWHRTQSKGYKWYCEPCMNETYGKEEETKPVEEEEEETDEDFLDYIKTGVLLTDDEIIKRAREQGRECPFQKWDQVCFKSKNSCTDPEFKNAARFVVDHVKPASNAPVCKWWLYVRVHNGSDKIDGFPLHNFTLLAASNDPDNYVA